MKKYILLLLLSCFAIQAQTLQNPTFGNVKLKNNTTDNSATKVNVQSTDGTINTIAKNDLIDVVEVNDVPSLPLVGNAGKIYVVKNLNKIYRWNGTFYSELAVTEKNIKKDFNKSYISEATSRNKRNSEGDILVLNNGKYLTAYTSFFDNGTDFSSSNIVSKISDDSSGNSWSNETVVSNNIGLKNVISVSLIRRDASTIDCFFLVRNSDTDLNLKRVTSTDEGISWSSASNILSGGYIDVLNAVVKRGNSNRILIPYEYVLDASAPTLLWKLGCYYSDNNGTTWTKSNEIADASFDGETSVVKLSGNNILFSSRSNTGYQKFTLSTDNGTTLGTTYVSTLKSVLAPAQIINYAGTIIALHNPNTVENLRNPLSISKSIDNGATWTKLADLENSTLGLKYAYPSLTLDGDNLLISYFEQKDYIGFSQKFTKINITALLNLDVPEAKSPSDLSLIKLSTIENSVVQPSDNVLSAIGKLQGQINENKGKSFYYEGIGQASIFKNTDPLGSMKDLYMSWLNKDNSVVSHIGFLGSDQKFYFYSTKPIKVEASKFEVMPDASFSGKVGVGTLTPNQQFVVSRSGNEGLEISVDDPVGKKITIQAYDRTAGAYRPISFEASGFSFDKPITASPATLDSHLATLGQVKSYTRPYKVYSAQLFQNGTSNPQIVTAHENSLSGAVSWTRSSTGIFIGNLTNAFTNGKLMYFFTFGSATSNTSYTQQTYMIRRIDASNIEIRNYSAGTLVDNFEASIEIRVYN